MGYLGDETQRLQQLFSKPSEGKLLQNAEISAEMTGPSTL
jgi:hypothetical protein